MADVTLTCKGCYQQFVTLYKYRNKRKYCSRNCADKAHTGEGNPSFGKTYRTKETHPEWAASISAGCITNEINVGEKNGMKRPEVAARMSKTRREKVTSDPVYREARSQCTRKAWADGKYDGVAVGRCKWYDHVRPDGSIVKLQGTWEVAFARRLDELSVSYDAHKGRWKYVALDSKERSYYPDFYVPMWDTTIDVKGVYWDDCCSKKFDAIRSSNLDKQLVIATRDVLENWKVDLLSVQRELLGYG